MAKTNISWEEREERIQYAISLIARTGKVWGVISRLRERFGCSYNGANRYVRAARDRIHSSLPDLIDAVRARGLAMLTDMLDDPKETNRGRRETLKLLFDLLGVEAPKKSEVTVRKPAGGLLQAYRDNPELKERALQFAKDLEYERRKSDTHPVGSWDSGGSRVSLPESHNGSRRGGNGHAPESGPKPSSN
jgi:hypothetical protein